MRHETDIYYRDYFERLAQEHSNFHYLVTLSRADQTWSGHRGYVQDHLDSIIASRKAVASSVASSKSVSVISSSEPIGEAVSDTVVAVEEALIADPAAAPAFDIHTYICGLNDMVAGVRARLTEFGWHKKQIVFERYD
jgi:NAD(P)H-flavin reductase